MNPDVYVNTCFNVDAMLYQMCVNPVCGNDFDMLSAYYTEIMPDGTRMRYNFESVNMPMETELTLIDRDSAIDLLNKYTHENYDIIEDIMLSYDMFATRKVDGKDVLYCWYDRSK